MNRRRRFVMAAATFAAVAVLVSPAGAATTAWTSGHLTKAVKGLTHYVNRDGKRDSRQGWKIRAAQHTNVIQNGKLRKLSAFRTATGGRLTALEAQNLIQAQLNGGILDLSRTVQLPVGSPGAPHGGWMFFTLSGDSYVVYNGGPGPKGDQGDQGAPGKDGSNGVDGAPGQNGAPGENGAPGLSAYQVWLAEGNTGTVGDFMKAITGAKGDQGDTGATGQNGKDGSNGVDGAMGAPGLSAYQEWLAAGNTGSIADFLHSIVGPQGPKGDQGAPGKDGADGAAGAPGQSAYQAWLALGNTGTVADFVHSLIGPQGPKGDKGDPGIPNATQTVICTLPNGNNVKLGWGANACNGRPDAQTVYIPTS